MLKLENESYGDVVVANIEETYYKNPTLKMLIALKFTSCYCPNVEYFVKCDDDVYFDVLRLDNIVKIEQRKLGKPMLSQNLIRSDSLYLGERNSQIVRRSGKWGVSYQRYPFPRFPPHMRGGVIVLSMKVVHQMALDCPYICIGLELGKSHSYGGKSCFWDFEDVFIGSCVASTQKKTFFSSSIHMKEMSEFISEVKSNKNAETFIHNLKHDDVKNVHLYYSNNKTILV